MYCILKVLREKYDVHVSVSINTDINDYICWTYEIINLNNGKYLYYAEYDFFISYEEALYNGLQKALTYIN